MSCETQGYLCCGLQLGYAHRREAMKQNCFSGIGCEREMRTAHPRTGGKHQFEDSKWAYERDIAMTEKKVPSTPQAPGGDPLNSGICSMPRSNRKFILPDLPSSCPLAEPFTFGSTDYASFLDASNYQLEEKVPKYWR